MQAAAIIVAAGSSTRMGRDKLATEVEGHSVLYRSVRIFLDMPQFQYVIVVCPEERFQNLLDGVKDRLHRVDGGKERADSVAAGLAVVPEYCNYVAVHDAARPLASRGAIMDCLEAAQRSGAAALAKPVIDTLTRSTPEGFSADSVSRKNLWAMETPQIFRTSLLKQAYREIGVQRELVTDEVTALGKIGYATQLVYNNTPNPKITHIADLPLVKALLAEEDPCACED